MNQQYKMLTKNVVEIISNDSLQVKLKSGKPLNIKLGADPTKPDLHLGHAVGLRKLKEFLEARHNVVFLIGDFTTKIGDPSGRNTMRPVLTDQEIKANVKTWLSQVKKVIDINKCEIRYNSEWFSKMSFEDLLKIASRVNLSDVIEREDFQKRISGGVHVAMSEIMYPIMQGYDSVELKSDLEIGGQDQKLNMLMGRDLQGIYGQEKQDVMILPLLSGTDGRKMSKSFGNYIGLADDPQDAFGKLMSISDDLIKEYLELATDFSDSEIKELVDALSSGENPKIIKEKMAHRVVSMYWGDKEASRAMEDFDKVFSKKGVPDNLKVLKMGSSKISLVDVLIKSGFAKSRSDARRLIKQSAVKVDQKVLSDEYDTMDLSSTTRTLQVGKRKFIKISK